MSGVYLLRCRDWPVADVGETGKSFSVRMEWAHLRIWKQQPNKICLYETHLLDEAHARGDEVILHTENNFNRRLALENIEITKKKHLYAYDLIDHGVHN